MSWADIATSEIVAKAAEYKKVKISPGAQVSEVFASFRINEKMLNFLFENYGFGSESNLERTIITDSETEESWIFNAERMDVFLSFGFKIDVKKRRVIFISRVRGPIQGSPLKQAEDKLFLCLADGYKRINTTQIPAIVQEIINSHDYPIVGWEEIGLGDISPIGDLFAEFADGEKRIMELSRSSASPFIPNPNHDLDEIFVFDSTQRKVVEGWKRQLEEYKAQIALLI